MGPVKSTLLRVALAMYRKFCDPPFLSFSFCSAK
jgi:hypothetical protein